MNPHGGYDKHSWPAQQNQSWLRLLLLEPLHVMTSSSCWDPNTISEAYNKEHGRFSCQRDTIPKKHIESCLRESANRTKKLPTEPITWMLLGVSHFRTSPPGRFGPLAKRHSLFGRLRHAFRGGGGTRLLLGPGQRRSKPAKAWKPQSWFDFGGASHLQEIQEDPVQDPWVDTGAFDHWFSVARNVWALGRWRYNGRSLLGGCSSSFNRKFLGWDHIRSQHRYTYYHVYI